jgi:hypothetical protein
MSDFLLSLPVSFWEDPAYFHTDPFRVWLNANWQDTHQMVHLRYMHNNWCFLWTDVEYDVSII